MGDTPILRPVAREDVERLVGKGALRVYRRGTYLFHQGEDSDAVYFLSTGRVEVSAVSSTGRRQLLTTLDAPHFFGELGVVGEQPRTATALALEECTAWTVAGPEFMRFIGEHAEASRALLRSLARQVEAHEAFVEDLLFLDLKGRVAKRLLQLVSPGLGELPADGTILPSVITHADLASLCGGSRENITRTLSLFQKRGLVDRDGRRYVLKDVAGLKSLAGL